MNKTIFELDPVDVGELSYDDCIPLFDISDGTTKKLEIKNLVGTSIGDIKTSMLSLAQFSSLNFGTWKLLDGSSCVGSAYQALTGNSTVPNAYTDGNFLRQAKAGRTLGSPEGDAIRNITAQTNFCSDSNGSMGVGPNGATGAFYGSGTPNAMISDANGTRLGSIYLNFDASRVVPTDTENRPKNIAVNFFIRID